MIKYTPLVRNPVPFAPAKVSSKGSRLPWCAEWWMGARGAVEIRPRVDVLDFTYGHYVVGKNEIFRGKLMSRRRKFFGLFFFCWVWISDIWICRGFNRTFDVVENDFEFFFWVVEVMKFYNSFRFNCNFIVSW